MKFNILDLGVELKTNNCFGTDVTFQDLDNEYDTFSLNLGNPKIRIPGQELNGVVEALEFIEDLKLNPYENVEVGKSVIVCI